MRKLLHKAQDEINGINQKKQVDLAEMRKYSLSKMQERPMTPVHIPDPELQVYTEVKYYFDLDLEHKPLYQKNKSKTLSYCCNVC